MPKGRKRQVKSTPVIWEISGILFCAICILSYVSFFSNKETLIYSLGQLYIDLFGIFSLFVPLLFGIVGFLFIYKKNNSIDIILNFILSTKFAGFVLLLISLFGISSQIKEKAGGTTGDEISNFFSSLFDISGSYVVLATIALIGITLIHSTSVSTAIDFILRNKNKIHNLQNSISNFMKFIKEKLNYIILLPKNIMKVKEKTEIISIPQSIQQSTETINQPTTIDIRDEIEKEKTEEIKEEKREEKETVKKQLSSRAWKLPDLSLLKYSKPQIEKNAGNQGDEIIKLLNEFGVEAEITNVEIGPVVTRYELRPAEGVKVKEITNLSNDIALRLAAAPIRIEAPIPGKAAIGIEVPNKTRDIVPIKDVLEKIPKDENLSHRLIFALGKDISGNYKIADLSRMPHLLIAGATGAGKSVSLNSLIASLLFRLTPDDVRFLLIDPKRVELSLYKGIPHLASKVITDVKQASVALSRAIDIMDKRYDDFAEAGVRDIYSFNSKYPEHKKFYFVIIIDELADMMLQVGQEVEKSICRLAQLGRATGIHLVIATQRPSVNVITGLIKANIPSRIAFAVVSQMDSRIILDCNGAENLLGSGDMLFLPIDAAKPTRMQGAFISEDDIKRLVEFWKGQGEAEYLEEFQDLPVDEKREILDSPDENVSDELFKEAVKTILENNQASVSILQRKLKIGYARAGRLIDMMERKGIVGPFAGSKQREILVGWDYLERL